MHYHAQAAVIVTILVVAIVVLLCCETLVHKKKQSYELVSVNIPPKRATSIAKHIIRTAEPEWHQLHPDVLQMYQQTERDNPGWSTRYFSARQRRLFLCKHFDRRVVRAYDKLIPGAFRADLFRFCAVYKLGGLYADFSTRFLVSIDSLVDSKHNSLVLCHDRSHNSRLHVYTAVFAARANHALMRMCIDKVVHNVEHLYYGVNPLHPTGPLLMREQFDAWQQDYPGAGLRFEMVHIRDNTVSLISQPSTDIAQHKMMCHAVALTNNDTRLPSYSDLWHDREVYHTGESKYKYHHLEAIHVTQETSMEKNIIRTGPHEYDSLASEVIDLFGQAEIDNPGWKTRYFSDLQCRQFIAKYFDASVLSAYDTLVPGAYKADLFRYCAVFVLGGVYIDFSGAFDKPIETWLDPTTDPLVLCHDFSHNGTLMLYNAVFAASSGHPFLLACINRVVSNTSARFYGINTLHPTGPLMFREVYDEFIAAQPDAPHRLQLVHSLIPAPNKISKNVKQLDNFVITTKAGGDRKHRQRLKEKCKHYSHLWRIKRVYTD